MNEIKSGMVWQNMKKPSSIKIILSAALLFQAALYGLTTSPALAHEYYLLPTDFAPPKGAEVAVEHRLGQRFKGNQLPYITQWNIRSEVWENGKGRSVKGVDGDRPALKVVPRGTGLTSVIHQSNIDFLTFKTWEKFQTYTEKEGITYAQKPSIDGVKPKVGLLEAYSRYAKTLITPGGTSEGEDGPTGLKIELVALRNPMALGAGEPMPVQLLYEGKPLEGATVKVFVGIDTEFKHRILTDSDGRVTIPAEGPGPYLLNAIKITDPQSDHPRMDKAHWESFWASLTYRRAQ